MGWLLKTAADGGRDNLGATKCEAMVRVRVRVRCFVGLGLGLGRLSSGLGLEFWLVRVAAFNENQSPVPRRGMGWVRIFNAKHALP